MLCGMINEGQEFSPFVAQLIRDKGLETVVEIGPDVKLERASRIAPACKRYSAIALPEDVQRMSGWYDLLAIPNLELIPGNAVSLSTLVPKADLVLVHNVLLDLTGEDTALMWKYRRGEIPASEEDWEMLRERFSQAFKRGYCEFLRVANPGYVATFQRKENAEGVQMDDFIKDYLRVPREKVDKRELFYDGSTDLWQAHIIDNT